MPAADASPPASPRPLSSDGRGRWKRTPAQHAQLVEWGNKWASVGKDWKRKQQRKGA